jgi:hypothetical protein
MNNPEITIDITALDHLTKKQAPLYEECNGQVGKAKLLLNQAGVCYFQTTHPYDNSTPAKEWHRVTLAWDLPPAVKGHEVHSLLTLPSTLALLQRIFEGHGEKWDGNNWKGTLDEDAHAAEDDLEQLLQDLATDYDRHWSMRDPQDWLSSTDITNIWPADMSLEAAASAVICEAAKFGIMCGLHEDVQRAIVAKLEAALEDGGFELSPAKKRELGR